MTSLLHPLFVVQTSVTQQDLARQVVFLREENRVLRSPKRIVVASLERSRLLKLGRELDTQLLRHISNVIYDNRVW